jgi:acetyl esterase/lipase
MPSIRLSRPAWTVWPTLVILSVAGCSDDPVQPDVSVDLEALFAPPTASEVDAISAEWAARASGAMGTTVERDTTVTSGGVDIRVRIVSHEVLGVRHYGAILSGSELAAPAPVLIYAHPGDDGAAVDDVLLLLNVAGDLATGFVWIIPSFRSEELRFGDASWTSQGPSSFLDRDVDDAMGLLDVALEVEPLADQDRVGALGFSRGAAVALLMGVRDDRVDRIVGFSGLTDLFDDFIQDVVEEALAGTPRDLPGLDELNERFIQPLARGEISVDSVRMELLRRSAVRYADDLPMVQIHHGSADDVVEVSQANSLISVMDALGRVEPDFEGYLYPGGTHNPFTLGGSFPLAVSYLGALATP